MQVGMDSMAHLVFSPTSFCAPSRRSSCFSENEKINESSQSMLFNKKASSQNIDSSVFLHMTVESRPSLWFIFGLRVALRVCVCECWYLRQCVYSRKAPLYGRKIGLVYWALGACSAFFARLCITPKRPRHQATVWNSPGAFQDYCSDTSVPEILLLMGFECFRRSRHQCEVDSSPFDSLEPWVWVL